MTKMSCQEIQELITGFVDNQISADEQIILRQHVEECPSCSSAVTLERRIKARARAAGARVTAPVELSLALQRKYGNQGASLWGSLKACLQMGLRPVPVMVIVFLILVPLVFFVVDSRQAVAVATLETHRAVVSGSVDVDPMKAQTPELLAQTLAQAVGGRFTPPVFHLARFGLHTAGGFKQKVRDRDMLVTVYAGQGDTLTCHTFLGDERDIPEAAQLIYDPVDGRKYFTFSDGSVNGVLQRYGDEICVLASRLPMEELMKVARSVHQPNQG